LPEAEIIGKYCIGADGPVASVALFSQVPIDRLDTVLLDTESRTSAALIQFLLKEYWKISPSILPAYPGYEKDIAGSTGALVIGDRALTLLGKPAFQYDLAAAWQALTGLPFVFAAWVSNKKMSADFIERFDQSVGFGLQYLETLAAAIDFPAYDLKTYYTKNIQYVLDAPKRKALALFLSKL
jgi:chorismate dehydratase